MKILIDIGHPGHVHLFKNLINKMTKDGHEFYITARDKEVAISLLNNYNFKYYNRGKGYNGFLGKAFGMLIIDFKIWIQALKFKPDILIGGVGNLYIAQVAKLLRKPSIIFDDTEHAILELAFVKKLATCIITPDVFQTDLGKKQIKYAGYHELAYLHPKYFTPDLKVHELLGIDANQKYVILRFVSWNASHDSGQSGFINEDKIKLVNELSKIVKVFISAEGKIPAVIEKHQIKIAPEKMHDVIAGAELFVGEGATMASEAVCIGTPAIYVNSLSVCYCTDQEKYGLLFHFKNSNGAIEKAISLLGEKKLKQDLEEKHVKLLETKIDVTAFMIWFIENFPMSEEIMKENPHYQYNFK